MAIKTRKQCRGQLGSVLDTALTGEGNPAQDVYDYLKSDFNHQSPIVTVGSEGLEAFEQDFEHWHPVYKYSINVYVTRNTATDYTEEDVEDTLDDVTQAIYETLETNRVLAGWWGDLAWLEPSAVVPVTVGGDPYWWESVVVGIAVYN